MLLNFEHLLTIKLRDTSPDIRIGVWDTKQDNTGCLLRLKLYKDKDEEAVVFSAIEKLILKADLSQKEVPLKIFLSNSDVLSAENRCFIQSNSFNLLNTSYGIAFITIDANLSSLISNGTEHYASLVSQQIACQKLRTYDIVKIEVDGVSFDVRGLRSAATFDAMFNALAAKTGKGHLYRSSGTSPSSSSVSSGPSASCELSNILVFSWGDIDCGVDKFHISGAKGKDVRVGVIFEDVSKEFVNYGFLKRFTSIPYDDCTYDEFWLEGKANGFAKLNRYNRGRFKVYVEVKVDNQLIYTSNAKYVTIYNDQGIWRRD